MKKIILFLVTLFVTGLVHLPAIAEEASIELGQKLFNNPWIGASGNDASCMACHQSGEVLKNAGENHNLTEIINKCITGPLQGEKLDEQSIVMRSLKMYIQSLGKK